MRVSPQDDVREWVGMVVADALRFAVRYDGGGEVARARDNWQAEEGSAAYVVDSLVIELKRTVALRPKPARPGQLPPRMWHEHVYNIAKVGGSLAGRGQESSRCPEGFVAETYGIEGRAACSSLARVDNANV